MLNLFRRILPMDMKIALGNTFPKIYELYERRIVFNTLGLKKFYNKEADALIMGKAVLPMEVICNSEYIGVFNTEFLDIIYPMLSGADLDGMRFADGPYEVGNVRLNKGDVVIDCGANMGLFSLMALNLDCTCYAFEPLPININSLNKVIKLNKNIILAPYAISDKNGVARFSNDFNKSGNKIISDSQENSITVDCITLDTFVESNRLSKVDFIKADIEGGERLLLKGAKGVLKEFEPKISICTYHLPDDPQVLRELILDANPKYKIEEKYKKMYAYVPE